MRVVDCASAPLERRPPGVIAVNFLFRVEVAQVRSLVRDVEEGIAFGAEPAYAVVAVVAAVDVFVDGPGDLF